MGKRTRGGGNNNNGTPSSTDPRNRSTPTMREEASGMKKKVKNENSMLKLKHLENLAIWASKDCVIPSLGSVYGRWFAELGDGLGVVDADHTSLISSQISCQRCETILQPGFNCKVRIEKNHAKKRQRGKKRASSTENSVVYTCHFCSHRNLKRGTQKGHIKGISPPKLHSTPDPAKSMPQKKVSVISQTTVSKTQVYETGHEAPPAISKSTEAEFPETPPVRPRVTLLFDSKRKRKASGLKKTADSLPFTDAETTPETSRKKRKSWTTLKEIAESSEHERIQKISSVAVPCPL